MAISLEPVSPSNNTSLSPQPVCNKLRRTCRLGDGWDMQGPIQMQEHDATLSTSLPAQAGPSEMPTCSPSAPLSAYDPALAYCAYFILLPLLLLCLLPFLLGDE